MNNPLKAYFYGTKNELRGILILLIILTITTFLRLYTFDTDKSSTQIDTKKFDGKIATIAAITQEKSSKYNNTKPSFSNTNTASLFYFNPNNTSKLDFEKLGLSPRTAQSIINYRNKGGQFFKAADFKKIYTLSEADYQRLSPYIQLPNQSKYPDNRSKSDNRSNEPTVAVELFEFNPNTASKADFERLGLSGRTAQSIINYRNKGGKFFKSEDLKKIYTLNSSDYERLESYINIPKSDKLTASKSEPKQFQNNNFKNANPNYIQKSSTVKIDINTAKKEDFQQLKGIGEGYAKRIIKYRDKLGGFTHIEQIKEVYGLEGETFETVKQQLVIKEKTLEKININTATYIDLVQHPYIDSKRANAIIKYRKQHGQYKSVNDLTKNYAISKAVFNKIKGYLTV